MSSTPPAPSPDPARVGTRLRVDVLRALMAERGWNAARLAEATGIHITGIGKLIDGRTAFTGLMIARFLHAFPQLAFEDLFTVGRVREHVSPVFDGDEAA